MTFDQHLRINEHFEKIINTIDINTENLLDNIERNLLKRKLEIENESEETKLILQERDDLNKKRQRLIEIIKSIEKKNLDLIDDNEKTESIEATGCSNNNIILDDCVLYEKQSVYKIINKLIIMPFYLNEINLEFFK